MNILITGSTGFVGKALLKHIEGSKTDDKIYLLSSRKNVNYETTQYKFEEGQYKLDVPKNIDVLIHLGAWIPKSTAVSDDVKGAFSNIQFTLELLNTLDSLKKIVFVSTIDVYAPTKEPISENSLVKPISLYGSSKKYCEDMVNVWSKEKLILCCILRLGHIYGVGESQYKKLIPILIEQALHNKPINIFSDGQEKRSFLDVEDCADVIWRAAHDDSTGVYNVVSGTPVCVADIARMVKVLSKSKSKIVILNKVNNTRDCIFDNTKLMNQFYIKEKPLEVGLMEEIEYFRSLSK